MVEYLRVFPHVGFFHSSAYKTPYLCGDGGPIISAIFCKYPGSERRGVNVRSFFLLACGCSGLLLGVAGCERRSPQAAPPEAPAVPVSRPVAREVTDYVDFTGRTQAVNSVNVVARATGYLVKMPFKEGSEVKAGDLLFEIDPRPYQAQYDQAVGQVNLYKAQLKLAQVTLARDEQLARNTPGAVSAQQLDQDRAAVDAGGCPGQSRGGQPGDLQAQFGFLQGDLAHRRPGEPLLPHARQPRHPGPNLADHRRFARSHVRLLSTSTSLPCCGSGGPSTRDEIKPYGSRAHSHPHGIAGRRRLSPQGSHRLRQ